MKLFIDTWGWLALRDRKESRHQEVKDFYIQFRRQKGIIYTSDYVLDETITLLFRRLPFKTAKESLENINKAIKEGYLQVEWVTPERFEKAKGRRIKYRDKPKISFTDLTSMVVMKELGIKDIITGDEHFEHIQMDFQIVP
ncbi:MAG: PIN domain-containing protein [Deltaproteobacteria bacterium]|nr:PIN domain-containing protein [Deltaproteobacteria bacterium]